MERKHNAARRHIRAEHADDPVQRVFGDCYLVSWIMENLAWQEIILSQCVSRTFREAANHPCVRNITFMSSASSEGPETRKAVAAAFNGHSVVPSPLLSEWPGPKFHHRFRKPEQLATPGSWQQMFLTLPPVTVAKPCLTYRSDTRPGILIVVKGLEVRDPTGLTIGSMLSKARQVRGEIAVIRRYDCQEPAMIEGAAPEALPSSTHDLQRFVTTLEALEEQLAAERPGCLPAETFSLEIDYIPYLPAVCWQY